MPAVVSRWQLVLLKNLVPARYVMLAPPQGACARSRVIVMSPWLVTNVRSRVPEAGRPLVAGVPVLVRNCATCGLALGVHTHEAMPGVTSAAGPGGSPAVGV